MLITFFSNFFTVLKSAHISVFFRNRAWILHILKVVETLLLIFENFKYKCTEIVSNNAKTPTFTV